MNCYKKSNNSNRTVTNCHCRVTDLEHISVNWYHHTRKPCPKNANSGTNTQNQKEKQKHISRAHTTIAAQASEFAQIIIVNAAVIPTPKFFAFIFAKFGVCFRLLHRSCHGATVTLKSRTVVRCRIYFHRAGAI